MNYKTLNAIQNKIEKHLCLTGDCPSPEAWKRYHYGLNDAEVFEFLRHLKDLVDLRLAGVSWQEILS